MQTYQTLSYDDMGKKAASIIASQIILKPSSVIGLATGSSPISTYKSLISLCAEGTLDFSQVKTFNLDEYVGLPVSNDQSYRYFMEDNLFKHVNVDPSNIDFLQGTTADPQQECKRYEAAIAAQGGIDLQLLGIGHNGHIAFNEPSDHFEYATFMVELTQSTIEANKRFFASIDDVPRKALTMGIGTIMKARKIVIVATGSDKAEIVKTAFTGPITPQVPASILQLHPDVTLVGDTEALSLM